MLDCLPSPDDWSLESQFLMLMEHLRAMRHHLDTLESAAAISAADLVREGPHLIEMNQRFLDAHELLEALSKQSRSALTGCKMEETNA